MVKVIKRDGKKQAFNSTKIRDSIRLSAKEAGLSSARIKMLMEEVAEPFIDWVKKKRVIKAIDIRRALLGRLERKSKSVVKSWKRFEKDKK